jgi:hypothetical protein
MITALKPNMEEVPMSTPSLRAEAVSALAYKFWEDEGRPEGQAEAHWLRAVQALSIPELAPVAPKAAKKKTKR